MKKLLYFYLICFTTYNAQERNYWNILGGSRSALMGGIVVGGVRDNSASFYNPGALGFINSSTHTISSDVYGYAMMRIKDGAGNGLNLVNSEFRTIPLMASGTFSLDFLIDDLKIGYTILTKSASKISFTSRIELYQDLIPENPNGIYAGNNQFLKTFEGDENVSAQYIVTQSSEEIWGGGSLSQKINENFSVGISGFGIYKTYTSRENIMVYAVDTSYFKTASNNSLSYQDLWNLSFVIKAGLAYQNDFVKLGLTITSPQVSLYGKAKVAGVFNSQNVLKIRNTQSNVDIPLDFTAEDRQQDLNTKISAPLSIAFGFETSLNNRINLAFSSEYFASLNEYSVARPASKSFFLALGNDQSIETNSAEVLKIVDEYKSVVNYGFAVEYLAAEKINAYLSFRTDFNNGVFKERNKYYLGFSKWDLYHFTLGGTFVNERSTFALGIGYSFSFQSNYNQLVNFSNLEINNDIYLYNKPGKASLSYQDISLILGYTYKLN